jgi:hypothetical protein
MTQSLPSISRAKIFLQKVNNCLLLGYAERGQMQSGGIAGAQPPANRGDASGIGDVHFSWNEANELN